MTSVTQSENDFDEGGLDPRMFASGGANTLIIEKTLFSPFQREKEPDMVRFTSDGTLVAFEFKFNPNRLIDYIVDWPFAGNRSRLNSESVITIQRRAHGSISRSSAVLYRSAVDEMLRNLGQIESASAFSASRLHEDDDFAKSSLTHPLTCLVYERLAQIPSGTKEAIQNVLNQFLNSVLHIESTNLPPLRLRLLDDSSYLMEWTFEDRRLGFSFEEDPKESGWYFVFSNASSEHCESGTLDQLEMNRMVGLMLRP